MNTKTMNPRTRIAFFSALLSALPMAWADPGVGSKSITIDDSSYSRIYRAVWFNPDTGTVHKIMKTEEKPPVLGAVIWIETSDPEFRFGPGIKNCSMAVIGYGEEAFTKAPLTVAEKIDKIEKKVLRSERKPVVLIETMNSKSLVIIDDLDERTKSFKFRWKPIKIENKSASEDLPELRWPPHKIEIHEAKLHLLAQHGDAAIPYLKRFIDKEVSKPSRNAYAYIPQVFTVLGEIHTDKSTGLIKECYGLPNMRAHAAMALSYKPYRPKAKDEYIDILKGKAGKFQRYYAVEACVEYNWKDALPYIKLIREKPFTWHDFRTAYRAKKILDDDPISDEMIKAYNDIRGNPKPEDTEKAKDIILQLPDKESVAVFSIDLLFMGYKRRTQQIDVIQNTAWDILRALPKDTTKPLIGRLLTSIDSKSKRAFPELKLFYESH
jgi:hypothetical protein